MRHGVSVETAVVCIRPYLSFLLGSRQDRIQKLQLRYHSHGAKDTLVARLNDKRRDYPLFNVLKQPKLVHNHIAHSLGTTSLDFELRVHHFRNIRTMLTDLIMEGIENLYSTKSILEKLQR